MKCMQNVAFRQERKDETNRQRIRHGCIVQDFDLYDDVVYVIFMVKNEIQACMKHGSMHCITFGEILVHFYFHLLFFDMIIF